MQPPPARPGGLKPHHAHGHALQALQIKPRIEAVWSASADEPAYRRARENLQQAQPIKVGARLAQWLTLLLP